MRLKRVSRGIHAAKRTENGYGSSVTVAALPLKAPCDDKEPSFVFRLIRTFMAGSARFPIIVGLMMLQLAGCAILPADGPSSRRAEAVTSAPLGESAIKIVDLSVEVTRQVIAVIRNPSFADDLGDGQIAGTDVGNGDLLSLTIIEAPPAMLFGSQSLSSSAAASLSSTVSPSGARSSEVPEQVVSNNGTIRVPFVGEIRASGRSTAAIASEIERRLRGLAHEPQVFVRTSRNATSNVTIIGEIANSLRMPLTPKGERLLDALAAGGGVRQPVGKMTVQVTRGSVVQAMPLESVIKDPRQNIVLQAGDVVTLLFQPYSFTVLGAARSNQEIAFEGTGLTLIQALGRMGGLDDQRANPKGVFIFRFEDPALFAGEGATPPAATKDGKVPVIYRVNMRDPATLFVAQSFPIKDKDVIYVSNAPLTDFSKFLQAVSQIVYPIATIQNSNLF